MQLQPRVQHPEPELWRALHEAPGIALQRDDGEASGWTAPVHGMPADRLAMAASRHSQDGLRSKRPD
ncbi:MAG: hypothetical protein WCJ87_05530 [Burkholderiales bacterium]